jgi:hypothetical protein
MVAPAPLRSGLRSGDAPVGEGAGRRVAVAP